MKYSCHSIKMEVDSAGVRHSALTKASSAAEIPTQPLSHVTGLQHARTSMMWQCFCATRCLRCECPHMPARACDCFVSKISDGIRAHRSYSAPVHDYFQTGISHAFSFGFGAAAKVKSLQSMHDIDWSDSSS